jgi:hypothetical protein
MSADEKEFLGVKRAKIWTYFILMVVLLGLVIVANFAWVNPDVARRGVHAFLGMPAWSFPLITAAVGALIFWLGLKVETDWPEALGAMLISGSVATGELMIGWQRFAIGGLRVLPYVIPFVVFVVLLGVGIAKSK